ncbi:MAG: acyltransferase family protein [Mesorhizobium sp.]|nr:acyltransferase family protein [Mesorhizobium sp.]MBL8579656.1 acyltransferase family protein [Mesorhizobium sp.]
MTNTDEVLGGEQTNAAPALGRLDARANRRRYDLDWLRVFAFGVLILYHIAMSYSTWDWFVASRYSSPAIEPFMGMVNPWRLSLLFFISGVAVRYLSDRMPVVEFVRRRIVRLLLPLIFGMFVVCMPQTYVSLRYWDEIPPGFLAFYRDWLGLGQYAFALPQWYHLWYVAYLLAYTLVVAACLPLLRGAGRVVADPLLAWLARGRGWLLLFVPALPFVFYVFALAPYFPWTYSLVGDWDLVARTFTAFIFGFMGAGNEHFWRAMDSVLSASVGVALVLGVLLLVAGLNSFEVGSDTVLLNAVLILREFYAWSVIAMLFGLARRFANHPSAILAYLTAAIFPYFILHQTIILVVAYWFTIYEVPLALEVGAMLFATVLGCGIAYEIIRRAGPVRLLFGLPLREKRPF